DEFFYFIEIKTKYVVANDSKLPTELELDQLNEFEIFIENNLMQNKISSYYVGRTSHSEQRVFYLLSNEKEGAEGLMEYLKENGKQRKFEYKIIENKQWKTYS